MATVLILTQPVDAHAAAVAIALRNMGHSVRLLHGNRIPARALTTFTIGNDSVGKFVFEDGEFDLLDGVDVVWNRRRANPELPPGRLNANDEPFAKRDLDVFGRSLWPLLSNMARWVNSYDAQVRSTSKMLQLKVARDLGISIPNTIMTNDPLRILSFIKSNRRTIYKPFSGTSEIVDGRAVAYETVEIFEKDVAKYEIQRLTIGIFQEYLEKSFEVRVTCFGPYCFGLKLNSGDKIPHLIDWRNYQLGTVDMSGIPVPDVISDQCRAFMTKMGVQFGAFDFVVGPSGNWTFLEINESGQFLFAEKADPAIRILDSFCHFLINPDQQEKCESFGDNTRFGDVLDDPSFGKVMAGEIVAL